MLDDNEGVPGINQTLQYTDEAFNIVAVESGGGFVNEDQGMS